MIYTVKAFIGVLTKTNGKQVVVRIDPDRGYVWDGVFEHLEEHHGPDILDNLKTRQRMKAVAAKLGYQVLVGSFIYEA